MGMEIELIFDFLLSSVAIDIIIKTKLVHESQMNVINESGSLIVLENWSDEIFSIPIEDSAPTISP